ncbi:YeeE/YedE family protein [Pseudomonas sp. EA_15y_Pfl1_P102]|uniref:YeeE/YedE family protein n=1 Tax=Pseudomonas sp. EA_15y_Pfl1_P102 TaxID=3088685 RepID=UPI0030DBDAD1
MSTPLFYAWVAGLVFGIGLLVSGMTNPAKVIGFLDVSGRWDPSLAFVMGGAIAVAAVGFKFARTRTRSLLGLPMNLPTARNIDRRLVMGSLLFGVGWGVAGICPGPALVLLGSGIPEGVVFVIAMLAGMGLFEWLERRRRRGASISASVDKAN